MPELPEVESVVRALKGASLLGKEVVSVEVFCSKISSELPREISGRRLTEIQRRGKYIHFLWDSDLKGKVSLIVHLRMTGQFLWKRESEPAGKHERVHFLFSDGARIAFQDTRRFATLDLTTDPDGFFAELGPEPLDPSFTAEAFFQRIRIYQKAVKASLLDQHLVVGIGNIYADEALWLAQIHPLRASSSLLKKECAQLYEAIRTVLKKGIENGGTSLGDAAPNFHHLNGRSGQNQEELFAYGQTSKPCVRCKTAIEKIVVNQRGTHFCPRCQV